MSDIWKYFVFLSMRNGLQNYAILKLRKLFQSFFFCQFKPNFGIDNDKYLGGIPEDVIKMYLTIIFEDLNYATYKSIV